MIDVRKYSYSSNLRDTAVDLLRELGEAAIFHDLGVQPGRHYVAAQVLAVIFSRLDCIYTYLYISMYMCLFSWHKFRPAGRVFVYCSCTQVAVF